MNRRMKTYRSHYLTCGLPLVPSRVSVPKTELMLESTEVLLLKFGMTRNKSQVV